MKHHLEQIAAVLAADFSGPAGPIPLERLLRRHHRLLAELREAGLTWEQISRLMAGAGVMRGDGLAFPACHLRGVFGRHRKRNPASQRKKSAPVPAMLSTGDTVPYSFADVDARQGAPQPHATPEDGRAARSIATAGSPPGGNRSVQARQDVGGQGPGSIGQPGASTAGDRTQVLALMRRSALARRVFE